MRGNHIIYGRNNPPEPDVTTEKDRAIIAKCTLQRTAGKKTWWNVLQGDRLVGHVRTTWGGQEFVLPGEHFQTRKHAGFTWGEGDPPHALAILKLLSA